jgi:hypothetical protein
LENFPEDFSKNFNLTLKPQKIICSVEEWGEKVEIVRRNYTPNKLIDDSSKTDYTSWTVD